MIKKIAITSILSSMIVAVALVLGGKADAGFSNLASNLLLVINLAGLFLFWRVIFQKKSIALGLLIIILKYPFIAYLVWMMSKQSWAQPGGIFVGVLVFLLSLIGVVVYTNAKQPKD